MSRHPSEVARQLSCAWWAYVAASCGLSSCEHTLAGLSTVAASYAFSHARGVVGSAERGR